MKNLGQPEILRQTRERLWTLQPRDLPVWGTMSVSQMICHLSLACEAALGDLPLAPMKSPSPRILKFFALRTNFRWPPNVKTTPELKRAIEQTQTTQECIDADIQHTVARMEELATGTRCAPAHPMFGPMSLADWHRWGYLHADHHLRQFGR